MLAFFSASLFKTIFAKKFYLKKKTRGVLHSAARKRPRLNGQDSLPTRMT